MRYVTKPARRGQPDTTTDALARGLGVFSIGLGVLELLAARTIARAIGMLGAAPLLRAYGVREIAQGVAILTSKDPAPWIWVRVAGDVLDLATLAPALDEDNRQQENAVLAAASVAGVTALDIYCAAKLSRESKQPLPPLHDYSDRRGLPASPEAMRGAASDFEVPRDFRGPDAMRPRNGS